MKELLRPALDIARGAGAILRRAFDEAKDHVGRKTTMIDLVTDTDRKTEDFILEAIDRRFPDHAVLAEESGARDRDGEFRWIVDPLDGTVNFAHRVPVFCVLIAVQQRLEDGNWETEVGIAYDPMRDEMFAARRGGGATLNGEPIHVSETDTLIEALMTTGFMYDRLLRYDDNHREFCRMNLLTQGVRRIGSAGLDLAWVACGRFDASWEYDLNAWDMAPGILIVEEASGTVTTVDGRKATLDAPSIVASNGRIHGATLSALASAKRLPVGSRAALGEHLPRELAIELEKLPPQPKGW